MLNGYVAEYLRISDDDVDIGEVKRESDSINNQRKVLQCYIHNHRELSGYPVKEFRDDGFSGVNFNRPGIQRLLKEVRQNKVACIIVKDLSRFGRNYIEVGDYIEQIFPFIGVRFIAVSDNFDSFKNSGGIEIGFKNLIHDLYSRDLSKKVKSVKRMHQEKGIYSGGDVPYGYIYTGCKKREQGGVYQPDPDAAQIVKKIFSLAADGNTPSEIAKCLNRDGIPTPGAYKNRTTNQNYQLKNEKSNLWTNIQVRGIIQNEVYMGIYICRKSSTVRPREVKQNEQSEYLKFENAHEKLVSRDTFEAAQKSIQIRGKRGKYKKTEQIHALKGKVKCGCCGYSMNRNGKPADYHYVCRMGDSCGSHLRVEAKILEKTVLETLQQLILIQEETELKRKEEKKQYFSKIDKLKEEKRFFEMKRDHCRSSRLVLYRQWKEEQITKEDYIVKRDEYTKQEADCQVKLQNLNECMERLSAAQSENITDNHLQTYHGIQSLTKELADELIEKIDVNDVDRIEITWKFKDL